MKNKYTSVSIRIILIFTCAILMSYAPILFPDFFGDWNCVGANYNHNSNLVGCLYADCGRHNPSIHWGYQHWLWFFMGLSLMVVQVIAMINFINKENEK